MGTTAYWRIYTNARTAEKALKLISGVEASLEMQCLEVLAKPNPEGGHIVAFATRHVHSTWSERVLEVITCAQRLGYGWGLTGSIAQELDLHTASARIPGVDFIHCLSTRNEAE